MIRLCDTSDTGAIYRVINAAAVAYDGVIPADRYHRPYMTLEELRTELERVTFYGWADDRQIVAVMGLEPVKDVHLIRHAYVLPEKQRRGLGRALLDHIMGLVHGRLLVGTWADASWAVGFYEKHGFTLRPDKDELLKKYWDIPARQIETSVVLGIDLGQ